MKAGVVAIIPARGGSKRLPRKNIYPFFGRPLMQWAIEACKASQHIDAIYVSTEDAEIKQVAQELGVNVIDRPAELARDTVWTQEVLKHAVTTLEKKGVAVDVVVRIQANSPQVRAAKIDEAIEKLRVSKRWEIFSVDERGFEDAAIHVMTKSVVFQQAFSVYKGVVQTNYQDVHTLEDIKRLEAQRITEIEQAAHAYLTQLHHYHVRHSWRGLVPVWLKSPHLSLWGWQTNVPLYRRWQLVLEQSPGLAALLNDRHCFARAQRMRVLDLGCGFGMYWPILREYGFRNFVGIDLFDLRGRQAYYQAAQAFVSRFCADCETKLIMDDVRNLSRHDVSPQSFDLILNIATTSTKAGSTGIPAPLFDTIRQQYGRPEVVPVHVEKAH